MCGQLLLRMVWRMCFVGGVYHISHVFFRNFLKMGFRLTTRSFLYTLLFKFKITITLCWRFCSTNWVSFLYPFDEKKKDDDYFNNKLYCCHKQNVCNLYSTLLLHYFYYDHLLVLLNLCLETICPILWRNGSVQRLHPSGIRFDSRLSHGTIHL